MSPAILVHTLVVTPFFASRAFPLMRSAPLPHLRGREEAGSVSFQQQTERHSRTTE